jgi:signal transduction histidine kinase
MAFVVVSVSGVTYFLLRRSLVQEIHNGQANVLKNFIGVCAEAMDLRDPLVVNGPARSLLKTVQGLAYAQFAPRDLPVAIPGQNNVFSAVFPTHAEALERNGPGFARKTVRVGREEIIDWSGPVDVNGQDMGTVHVGFFQKDMDAALRERSARLQVRLLIVALLGFAVGLMAALWMSGQLTRPIGLLAEGAKSLGDGNLDTQINFERDDELGLLAKEFNIMAVKLKELDQLKDDFVSSVSHELRSPLAAISGYVELLTAKPLEDIKPEKRNKAFGIIQESTQRLTGFINDILDLAKLKAGRVEIRKSPVSIRQTATDILNLFQPLFEKKKQTGLLDMPEDMPVIPLDEEKVKQVITNLISNAHKFTPEGGSITVQGIYDDKMITVSVMDTGVGIPKDFVGQLFERFKQVPGTREKIGGPKGTGLGLAIAKGIVEAHGGKIWAESDQEKAKGSSFRFTLPREASTEPVQAKIFN